MKHYTDPAKVKALISLGDISSLEAEIEPKAELAPSRYADMDGDGKKKMVKHTFDTPQEGVVVAYHRDRDEDWEVVKPREDKSVKDFIDGDWEEYGYLFVGGAWYCVYMDYKGGKEFRRTVKLTKEFCLRCEDEDYTPEYTDIPDGK